jgi:uncharacterized protein (TIGR00730 family)
MHGLVFLERNDMESRKIGVMCGSSEVCADHFLELATGVGRVLGQNEFTVIYGGGARGLMRRVADGALEQNAKVHGYMPKFMTEVEWQHPGLTKLEIVQDMSTRKELMRNHSDATVFLPGGSGTMEELFEWMVAKRLGFYNGPLIIINHRGYYDPLKDLLSNIQKEKFHNEIHQNMWTFIDSTDELINAINNPPKWEEDAIKFAAVKHD